MNTHSQTLVHQRPVALGVCLLATAACARQLPPRTTAVSSVADVTAPSVVAQPSPVGIMVHIHAASFLMGSATGELDEGPVHEVRIDAFDLDLTEVTVSQYEGCVQAGGCAAAGSSAQWAGITTVDAEFYGDECNRDRADRQDHAANCVDWSMADTYCRWAGKRLPTEEEWEYAACGGNCDVALNSGSERAIVRGAARFPGTGRVARGRPGVFGLYDMAGNVWEWTASRYCSYDNPGCDDPHRVVRGGSWSLVDDVFVRLSDRAPSDPSARNTNLGFRCARDDAH